MCTSTGALPRTDRLCAFVAVVLIASLSTSALASPDPDTFSLDGLSPSPVDPADLLNPGGPPPATQVPKANLGLVLGDELDALSSGMDAVQDLNILYFSVDRSSLGLAGPLGPLDVFGQAAVGQEAGDVFVTTTGIGVSSVPIGINALRDNQTLMGEIPLIGPLVATRQPIDNLDALNFQEFDLSGDLVQDIGVYFSLDAFSASVPALGVAADILLSPAGGGAAAVFAPAGSMGLTAADDLDALALLDLGTPGLLDPGVDLALFSLAPGSPTLAGMGASPADIFMTTFAGVSWVHYPAGALGLLPEDNVNALEVQVPEPTCLALLLVTGAGLAIRRRR